MTVVLAVAIVTLFLLASVLSFISGLRYNDWTGKLFAPVLFVWPLLWVYAVVFPNEQEVRQLIARWAFVVLALALAVWRVGVMWLQTEMWKRWKR